MARCGRAISHVAIQARGWHPRRLALHQRARALHWRSILVPHDFSASAARALDLAVAEASVHGAEISLLHVVEMLPQFGPDSTLILPEPGGTPIGMHAHFRQRAEAELAEIGHALGGSDVPNKAAAPERGRASSVLAGNGPAGSRTLLGPSWSRAPRVLPREIALTTPRL